MHQCLGPCSEAHRNSQEYSQEVVNVRNFLSGFADKLVSSLENKMYKYADDCEFEKANEIKYTIHSIKKVLNNGENFYNSIGDKNFVLILPMNRPKNWLIFSFSEIQDYTFIKQLGKKAKSTKL